MTDNGLIETTSCPLCGGYVISAETVYTAPYLIINFSGGALPMATISHYVYCMECGTKILSPRMTDERIAEFYASGAYRATLGISQESMDEDEIRRAGAIISYLTDHNIHPRRHIDIGSSRGYLVEKMRFEFGANSAGMDLNANYSQVEDDSITDRPDLITAIHVLEHTTDPIAEIEKWAGMTEDYLLIEVPGEKCNGGPLRWAHTFYFPPVVLRRMIERAGMEIIDFSVAINTRILARKAAA